METLYCLVSKIPDVMWSAIVASLLTIFGVLLTNKGNERRQASMLEHEKEKFQAEQKLALKKEVFLNLASSFADVLEVFPKLANLEFSEKDVQNKINDHSGIVAKSYLVAKESSVAKILDFSAETAEAFINISKERFILLDHAKAIEIYQTGIDSANSEKNRLLSIIKEFNLQGTTDKSASDYLIKSYELQENIVKTNKKSIEEQRSILQPLHIDFTRKCIKEHARLVSLLPPMTIALRKELDNHEDSDIFIEALNKNISRMNTAFENLIKDMES